jgi:hypothetical protein
MCDHEIYRNWRDVLSEYFDEVKEIELTKYEFSKEYDYPQKYSWVNYSLNKWQCLKYEEYDKILFCDIDMLPVDTRFYDAFNVDTPALHVEGKTEIESNSFRVNMNGVSYRQILSCMDKKIWKVDGGLCLFKPSKKDFMEYTKLTDELYKDGIYSIRTSGPDETSMFYFYLIKGEINKLDDRAAVVPWDSSLELTRAAWCYNYLSYVKPWLKRRDEQWKEERLWTDIFEKMQPSKKLRDLSKEQIEKQHEVFLNMTMREKRRYYVMKKEPEEYGYGILDIKMLKPLVS